MTKKKVKKKRGKIKTAVIVLNTSGTVDNDFVQGLSHKKSFVYVENDLTEVFLNVVIDR